MILLLQTVISVHTELVAVPVIVTGARGERVSGLTEENFRVFEDGRRRDIVGLTPDPQTARTAFRKIHVTVSAPGRGGLRVRTRSGYVLEP